MTRRGGSPRTASRAGAAETAQRPLTVTARPASSVTSASRAAGKTRPGAAPLTRPGQGRPAGRRGSVFSPNGMGVTWSCTFLPPPRTGRSTASCPSMACTRMAARATRSLTSVSPHSASCCPAARTTWSGASRSAAMPPGVFSSPGRRPAASPSSCQRTRSATAAADSSPSCRQSLLLSRPSAQPARDLHPDAGQPAGGQAVVQPSGQRLGREHHRLGPRFRRVELAAPRTGPRAAGGSRAAGSPGRGPAGARTPPRRRTCWPRRGRAARRNPRACPGPAAPAALSGPGRIRSWSARTLTGWAARNLAVPPGGTVVPSRAARSAANSPSATPARPATPRSASAAVILAASAVSPPK